jgi:prepilin-type N-terminal cleavage/methylation domain-containing protein
MLGTPEHVARKVLLHALGMGKRRARGFTLVEMMIVVVIAGVLVTLAIFGVRRYLYAAKSSEAINMIGSIKSAQEAYRDETFTYLNVTGEIDNYYPQSPIEHKREKKKWGVDGPGLANWRTLGVTTDQFVQFGYACVAGAAGDGPPDVKTNQEIKWPTPNGVWYVVKAIGDQDGDGDPSIYVSSSFSSEIYFENESE